MRSRVGWVAFAMLVALGCGRQGLYLGGDDDDDNDNNDVVTQTPTPPASGRVTIDIPFTPTSDETDVPILVILDSTRAPYSQMQPDGSDLRFVDPSTDTVLPHEVELWDPLKTSCIWVLIPTIRSDGTSSVWMEYGDHGRPAPPPPTDVWGNGYLSVLHLSENVIDESTAGTHFDSTGLGNDGLQRNNAAMVAATGEVLQELDGANDYIELDGAGFAGISDQITIYTRVNRDTNTTSFPHVLGAEQGGDPRIWQLFYWDFNNSGCFTSWTARFSIQGNSTDVCPVGTPEGEWNELVMRYDGVELAFFIDGVLQDTAQDTGDIDSFDTLFVGSNPGIAAREFHGLVDSVRVSSVRRSDDWIRFQSLLVRDQILVYGPPAPL